MLVLKANGLKRKQTKEKETIEGRHSHYIEPSNALD